MSFFPFAGPPPSYATVDGGVSSIFNQTQQLYSENNAKADVVGDTSSSSSSSPSSSSVTSSITVVIIVLSSAIIITASIYILLRCFSQSHRTNTTYAASNGGVVLRGNNNNNNNDNNTNTSSISNDVHVPRKDITNPSLPAFNFGSLNGNLTGGDCAVCLSKFELHDELRLLPLCCHAFHARCIDAWLSNNKTCPLCRSAVNPADADVLNKIFSLSNNTDHHHRTGAGNDNRDRGNFRVEIGSVSSEQRGPGGEAGDGRRSYSVGSFEYIMDHCGYEASVDSTHRRGPSVDKVLGPPGEILTSEISTERSWLREYVDRLSMFSITSRTTSLRSSGRFFSGSSRRSDAVVPVDDLEANANANANRMGEEISELFRWLSGV